MTVKKGLFLLSLVMVLIIAFFAWYNVSKLKTKAFAPQKHVLLITLDTTRTDYLGCYGSVENTSPNLDKLAMESVVFDLAIAQAAVTPVSHASILTGLNPYNHNLRVMHGLVDNSLSEEQITIAKVWKEAGGRTSAFVSAFPVTEAFGLGQGFEHFDAEFPQADGEGLVSESGNVNTGKSQRRAEETTDAAIKWLDKKFNKKKPLLMWVHYFDPHDPYVVPPRDFKANFKPTSNEKDDILRMIYKTEVFYMDYHIGRLLEAFSQEGLWKDTIVVVVGDHGEGLGDHDWWTHGILYQEQIGVPQIIRIPGVRGGIRVNSLVRTIDLMPTVLEAAGVSTEMYPEMDGKSLMRAINTGMTEEPLLGYSDSVNMLTYGRPDVRDKRDQKNDKLYCVMDEKYKLIYHQLRPEESEFYDLQTDPKEMKNLWKDKPAEMERLMKELESRNAFSEILPGMTPTDAEWLNKLKGLGYVE